MTGHWPCTAATAAAALWLAACGGSDPGTDERAGPLQTQYETLLTQAEAAREDVQSLALPGPCTTDSQCSTLTLASPLPPCYDDERHDYSTASPQAAAAEAAARRHHALARQARAIAPSRPVRAGCFTQVELAPLICENSRCQRGLRVGAGS
ncbi:hypothetical protein CLD22_20810 [Rubrivivax gelatinosus]|nr:hypothetical protein [Rubrivivax gelatinosus]